MRDRALNARNAEETLLRLLDALGNCCGHLFGLAVADTNLAVAVTDDYKSREAEPATALDNLGDTVDGDDALDVRGLLLARSALLAILALACAAPAALRC